jgi:hypothetical protein
MVCFAGRLLRSIGKYIGDIAKKLVRFVTQCFKSKSHCSSSVVNLSLLSSTCLHSEEVLCYFACFGSQQSGEFRAHSLFEIVGRILSSSASVHFNIIYVTLLSGLTFVT